MLNGADLLSHVPPFSIGPEGVVHDRSMIVVVDAWTRGRVDAVTTSSQGTACSTPSVRGGVTRAQAACAGTFRWWVQAVPAPRRQE